MRLGRKTAILAGALFAMTAGGMARADHDHARKDVPAVDRVKGHLSVMVLGSGGPMADPSGRASAGYLIFVEGKPRILMDVGGGTFQRLAQSGTKIPGLDIILLSHLHIDHTADLSAMIKTIYFHNKQAGTFRTSAIRIYGPGENHVPFPGTKVSQYPAVSEYAHEHYDIPGGVERYLHVFTKAITGGVFNYTATDISPSVSDPETTVLDEDGLVIKAIGVIHGPVPALAYRIEYDGKSIVYSGDTSSKTGNMATIAAGADLLIYDTAIMDNLPDVNVNPADAVFFALHTTPTRIGQVAAQAQPRQLLLSHLTPITETRLLQVKSLIRGQGYTGEIRAANDLDVYNLDVDADWHHHEHR